MIFFWIKQLLSRVLWLIKPVTASQVAKYKHTEKCRVCGHTGVDHRCVHMVVDKRQNKTGLAVLLQLRCLNCGARSYGEPIIKVDATSIAPAVPRTDLERAEDDTSFRALNVSSGPIQ